MQDEQLDNLINEAASQHHPPYNDKAWDKMQAKLDAHLPKKDSRKKLGWFIFLLLLVGGGAFYAGSFFSIKNRDSNNSPVQNNTTTIASVEPLSPSTGVSSPVNNTGEQLNSKTNISPQQISVGTDQNSNTASNNTRHSFTLRSVAKTRVRIMPATTGESNQEKMVTDEPLVQTVNDPVQSRPISPVTSVSTTETPDIKTTITEKEQEPVKEKAISKNNEVVTNKEKTQKEKKKTKPGFLPNLAISFSAGPDISYVGDEKPGKVTFNYGAGINYTISKRLSVATGFYVSKKVYTADSAYYKTPAGFFPANYKVNTIDANCKVYEIPITIIYQFAKGKKHSWFAGTGLSSYLMKKEIYNYDYKYGYYPTVYHKEYIVNNENKHWFSVLTLSGGYEYKFSNAVSFTASPYIKLPLAGVGFGKVKLNSGGVLFTALVKPFAGKK